MLQIRKSIAKEDMKEVFEAIVEIDKTYVGGKWEVNNVEVIKKIWDALMSQKNIYICNIFEIQ